MSPIRGGEQPRHAPSLGKERGGRGAAGSEALKQRDITDGPPVILPLALGQQASGVKRSQGMSSGDAVLL